MSSPPAHEGNDLSPAVQDGHPNLLSPIMQSPTFQEELDGLIQEQLKKGGSSSGLWALRQISDLLSAGWPSSLPVPSSCQLTVTPINDLPGSELTSLVKGERLMRCKLASVYRLFDLYGWAQLSHTYLTLRVSKEQEHFLVLPDGLSHSEATAHSLLKVNVLGEIVEAGCTSLGLDEGSFSLHAAIYSARPDLRCLLHLHTSATAAVSTMKCGLLPLSHEALLVGEVAYYSYKGGVEEPEDRVELQKNLGPSCKVLVLRNHGIVALGESVEEAFYITYHINAACEIQVSALCSAGGEQNLIMLDRATHKPNPVGTVGWAGSTFGPLHKSRLGEHEFEALMRVLDNLGYRTGYPFRFPVQLNRVRSRKDVEVPATISAFAYFEGGGSLQRPRLPSYSMRQRQEKTKWLNTPNSYLRVSQESPGHQRTTWLKAEEVKQGGGSPIKLENANQFVPLYTDPQEVLETRNKIRQQNRQEINWAGPQSQLLTSVLGDLCNSESTDSLLAAAESKDKCAPAPEPEPPNPFSQLTDKDLEEYQLEVQRKQQAEHDLDGLLPVNEGTGSPSNSPSNNPPTAPACSDANTSATTLHNGEQEQEDLEKGMKALNTEDALLSTPTAKTSTKPTGNAPEASPSKKKRKFRTPSFLKKSRKQKEKTEA